MIVQDLPIQTLKMIARGHLAISPPRAFTDMIFQVSVEGTVSEAQLETLAREASSGCFAENTLKKAIPVTTELRLNGRKILSWTHGPEGASTPGMAG